MDAQGFLEALAPALVDAEARERFLADPRAALVAAGLDLPEWFSVTAREGDAPELTITLPGLLNLDADLSNEQLTDITAGWTRGTGASWGPILGPDDPLLHVLRMYGA